MSKCAGVDGEGQQASRSGARRVVASSQKRRTPGGLGRGGEVWWVEPAERGGDRIKHGRCLKHSPGHADRGAAWGEEGC